MFSEGCLKGANVTVTTLLVQPPSPLRSQVIRILSERGHILQVFSDPEKVLDNWPDAQCALLMLDMTAFGERGLQLCKTIRRRKDGNWVIIVAVFVQFQEMEIGDAIRNGADDYLTHQDEKDWELRLAVIENRVQDRLMHRRIMHDLMRTEIQFREVLETAPDAIIGVDQHGIIRLLNERVVSMTGYARAELIGQPIELLIPESLRQRHIEQRTRLIANPAPRALGQAIHLEWQRKDGRTIPVDICLGYFREEDQLYVIAAVRDVSEQRQLEMQLRNAKETAERALSQMQQDLQLAAQVQRSLLPDHAAKVPGLEWAWEYAPSSQLGGDGLNVFQLDHRHWGLYLLDVSGHGVAAALLSVSLARLFSSLPNQFLKWTVSVNQDTPPAIIPPVEVAKRVNHWFMANPSIDHFFSMIYAIYDTQTRKLRYVSAGHPGLVQLLASGQLHVGSSTGPIVGLMDNPEFVEEEIDIAIGDRIVFYSDGVTEAFNPRDEVYGLPRFLHMLQEQRKVPLAKCLNAVLTDVRQWSALHLHDDVSLLAIEGQ